MAGGGGVNGDGGGARETRAGQRLAEGVRAAASAD